MPLCKRFSKRFHNDFTRTSSALCSPFWLFLLSWLALSQQAPPVLNAPSIRCLKHLHLVGSCCILGDVVQLVWQPDLHTNTTPLCYPSLVAATTHPPTNTHIHQPQHTHTHTPTHTHTNTHPPPPPPHQSGPAGLRLFSHTDIRHQLFFFALV